MALSETSTYLLATAPGVDDPANSRQLAVGTGLTVQDTGPQGTFTIVPTRMLGSIETLDTEGYLVRTTGDEAVTRRLKNIDGTISVFDEIGASGDTVFSSISSTSVQLSNYSFNDTLVGTRDTLNFKAGPGIGITMTDTSTGVEVLLSSGTTSGGVDDVKTNLIEAQTQNAPATLWAADTLTSLTIGGTGTATMEIGTGFGDTLSLGKNSSGELDIGTGMEGIDALISIGDHSEAHVSIGNFIAGEGYIQIGQNCPNASSIGYGCAGMSICTDMTGGVLDIGAAAPSPIEIGRSSGGVFIGEGAPGGVMIGIGASSGGVLIGNSSPALIGIGESSAGGIEIGDGASGIIAIGQSASSTIEIGLNATGDLNIGRDLTNDATISIGTGCPNTLTIGNNASGQIEIGTSCSGGLSIGQSASDDIEIGRSASVFVGIAQNATQVALGESCTNINIGTAAGTGTHTIGAPGSTTTFPGNVTVDGILTATILNPRSYFAGFINISGQSTAGAAGYLITANGGIATLAVDFSINLLTGIITYDGLATKTFEITVDIYTTSVTLGPVVTDGLRTAVAVNGGSTTPEGMLAISNYNSYSSSSFSTLKTLNTGDTIRIFQISERLLTYTYSGQANFTITQV